MSDTTHMSSQNLRQIDTSPTCRRHVADMSPTFPAKRHIMPVLAAYRNFFLFFFFVVCRFCTSKRSFGYFCLRWAMLVTTSQRSSSNFLVGKKDSSLQTQHHNSSNNYIKIECRDDRNVLIAQQISDALQTKVARALLTPYGRGASFWSAFPCDVFQF